MAAFNPNAKKFNETASTVDELADQIDLCLFGPSFSQETTAPPIRRNLIESMVRRFVDAIKEPAALTCGNDPTWPRDEGPSSY